MAIRTQEEMCEHFLPILKEKGTHVRKKGMRLARPARPGEEVLTIVNGEVVARTKAKQSGSMVIRQESADHEFYLLDPEKFAKNYDTAGVDITEAGPTFDQLRQRNFKYYRRKGELLLYQVTEEDMSFVTARKFQVAFSASPVPLSLGDFLVTALPELSEIWVSKHSVIYEDGGQLSKSPGARLQAEMCEHFVPIMKDHGRVLEKKGTRLARPAIRGEEVLTIVNGEIMARTQVTDNTSMVVRQESADHELYVLSLEKFQSSYEETAGDVEETEMGYKEFRERGFKPYWRKGQVLIYEVTEQDMSFLPGGKFYTAFSPIPITIKPGCFLVTDYPGCNEIWLSRNAAVYNDGQFQGPGVRTQEEMRDHFLPLMRLRGMKMRRAGRRLARPARRGEEVLTIINGEVVTKTIVLDDTSMVVQEESVDREVYALDGQSFAETYRFAAELPRKGPEYDVLRARGFKIYEKTAGMFLVYKVTEEDMDFVPKGKFQVPFSIVPQPLRPGDYLVTRLPEKKVVYLSRNVDQVFLSRENLEVQFAFASPLTYSPLCIEGELEGLRTAGVVVRLTCATRENLVRLKGAWASSPTVLHISCHTALRRSEHSVEVASILEDCRGAAHPVTPEAFADLVIGGGSAPQLLVALSCHSEALALTCLDRGVRRAVAVRAQSSLLDSAARDFTLTFYAELRTHWNVQRAFLMALESMRASREPGVAGEAEKLVLLPEGAPEFELGGQACVLGLPEDSPPEMDKTIAVRMPFSAGEVAVGALEQSRLERLSELLPHSRGLFISQALAGFSSYRALKVSGETPADLQDFAAALVRFACYPGGRLFPGGAVVVKSEVQGGVLSQQQMCDIFLPIMRSHGTLVRKMGRRLARPALRGEEVQTIINGECVAKTVVTDDSSYVIQQDSVDRELYVLSEEKFERNYELPGFDISEKSPESDLMRHLSRASENYLELLLM
ncbi:unnamed protein product [Effrenium voratum]|uniref:Uncharacterized protein n=2 Tax=Effrenium voratum TaxID=2562239 RepID=A0AA36HVL6_9DINO|nr:unnamed protein product [Effrenium voratum]